MLHNEKEFFETTIISCSEQTGIAPAVIEKDYYVTLFLREIASLAPEVVFKGGTSLSKCYGLINRFSEDIDLSLCGSGKATEEQRKRLVQAVRNTIEENGFNLENAEQIRSRREFNRFLVNVDSLFFSEYIKKDLIIETSTFTRSYPIEKMNVSSYIQNYFESIGRNELVEEYNLHPFRMAVQSLERTFIDKIFAICDYYLDGKSDGHSRHLYDLYKIAERIVIDENLKNLLQEVRQDRMSHEKCFSAQEGINLQECLLEIVRQDTFKNDYDTLTSSLIFDGVKYETVRENLQKTAESDLFKL